MNRDFPKQCSSRGTDQERKHCNEKSRREWSKGVHKAHAEERRGGRVEHCRQRLPRLDTVQGLIMADIPAHNHKFLSIMWGKSLHCQSRCPVQK